ncbi:hypothetical protein ScPMuIL_007331 [Solemya velum]
MSKTPAPQSTAAPKKGHSDPKTLPVPRPLSPRSGAAQKLSAPKPDSSGSGAAQRVVSGLRLRTTFSVAGDGSVWGGGLCVAGEDLAWVGGRGSVRTIDTAGRVTGTVSGVCRSESWCSRIVRGDDGEVKGDVAVADYGGKVCILDGQYKHVGTYSPTKSEPFRPSV